MPKFVKRIDIYPNIFVYCSIKMYGIIASKSGICSPYYVYSTKWNNTQSYIILFYSNDLKAKNSIRQ